MAEPRILKQRERELAARAKAEDTARQQRKAAATRRGQQSLEAYRPSSVTGALYNAAERAIAGANRLFGVNEREAAQRGSSAISNLKNITEGLLGVEETEGAFQRIANGNADAGDYALAGLAVAPLPAPLRRTAGKAGKKVAKEVKSLAAKAKSTRPGRYLTESRAIPETRPRYTRTTEGPFVNVKREGVEREMQKAPAAAQARTMSQLRAIAQDPTQSAAPRVANEAAIMARGVPYDFNAPKPVSSLARQGGIGRAYQEAVSDNPAYKHALFERYGEMMPQVVEQAKAQNLDQLTEAAYRQLGEEVAGQFDRLPVTTRYHEGVGEYGSPNDMMRDVLANANLNVFSGGEPHEFLSQIDPVTGLSQNEMFRAVHDYMGHVVPGSMFGAPGEEIAYAAHSQTLSPLAQLALLSETRGQNSWVNYGGANADLIGQMNLIKKQLKERQFAEEWLAKNPNDRWSEETRAALTRLPTSDDARRQLHELGAQFQYAPQRAVLLPPEYLDPMTPGGMPDWLRPLLQVQNASNDVRGVHFSRSPDLQTTDPAMYGTGAPSGERPMVRREGLPDRTYFYAGPEGTVNPEESVGRVGKNVYEARLGNLYDINVDPENLLKLSRAYNLDTYKPEVPEYLQMQGKLDPGQSVPDMERLIRDYGYSGFLSDFGPSWDPSSRRAAAVYEPVSGLRRIERGAAGYAEGGLAS